MPSSRPLTCCTCIKVVGYSWKNSRVVSACDIFCENFILYYFIIFLSVCLPGLAQYGLFIVFSAAVKCWSLSLSPSLSLSLIFQILYLRERSKVMVYGMLLQNANRGWGQPHPQIWHWIILIKRSQLRRLKKNRSTWQAIISQKGIEVGHKYILLCRIETGTVLEIWQSYYILAWGTRNGDIRHWPKYCHKFVLHITCTTLWAVWIFHFFLPCIKCVIYVSTMLK